VQAAFFGGASMSSGIALVIAGIAAVCVLVAAMVIVIDSVGVAIALSLYAAVLSVMCGVGFGPPLIPVALIGLSLAALAAMLVWRGRRSGDPIAGALRLLNSLDRDGGARRDVN